MADLPTGTVTLLFTDIEGSTAILQRLGERYAAALAEYRALVRAEVATAGGSEVDTQGDAFFVVFPRAIDALHAVVGIQRKLHSRDWPEGVGMRTRMALHTGERHQVDTGYIGLVAAGATGKGRLT